MSTAIAPRLLRTEAAALIPILRATPGDAFARPTVCPGWSVRDVLSHCSAALAAVASGSLHRFTPEDNEVDVAARRPWPLEDVLDELERGYEAAAEAIERAGGTLDDIALGEWVHGGDVRDAFELPDAYASAGIDDALTLIEARSKSRHAARVDVHTGGRKLEFGEGDMQGALHADAATFVRLVAGRRPDPAQFTLTGVPMEAVLLFS